MTAPHATAPPELRLRSAQELFAALHAADIGVRLSTLAAIMENPDTAQAFGSAEGRDVVDELIGMVRDAPPSLVRQAASAALFAFKDQRSLDQALWMFRHGTDMEAIIMAGRRIGREADVAVREYLLPFLAATAAAPQRRIAARMLAGRAGLLPNDLLRIALLAGETGAEPPALTAETLPLWCTELTGDLAAAARGFLLAKGKEAFLCLKEHWHLLDSGTKAWLAAWGAADFPDEAVALLLAALAEGDEDVRLAALESVPRYDSERAALFLPSITSGTAGNDSKRWTVAKLRAGVAVDGLRERIFSEQDVEIRIALIQRLLREHAPEAILVKLLEDADWRIRAAATEVLVSLGERSAAAVAGLLQHENIAVRTAASQVMQHAGRGKTAALPANNTPAQA